MQSCRLSACVPVSSKIPHARDLQEKIHPLIFIEPFVAVLIIVSQPGDRSILGDLLGGFGMCCGSGFSSLLNLEGVDAWLNVKLM